MSISCNIDGANLTFNTNAEALRFDVGGASSIQIIGFQGVVGSSDQIAIALSSIEPIEAGTYDETGSVNGHAASVFFVKQGSSFPYINNNSTTNPATVTVTSVNATSIQGTFKGDVYLTDASGITNTKKVILNGQFNLNF